MRKLSKRLKELISKPSKGSKPLGVFDTQVQEIALVLSLGSSISPLRALRRYGIFRLAAVICVLRHDYHMRIKTEIKKVRTRRGTARVAFYSWK